MDIKNLIGKKVLLFDGAMGTMLQDYGLKIGQMPELLNIEESEKIINIHKKYIDAGANIITTNTFGANEIKLKFTDYTVKDIIKKAVENAKEATKESDAFIALDIGPIGQLLEPLGTLKFDEAYEIFKSQVLEGVEAKVDLIIIETMTDLYEVKAAILAVKENSNLPVICTMSFQEDKRTFTGCSIKSMIMTMEALGIDALGVNCSLGPLQLQDIVDEILTYSSLPVIVQPNAGLPIMKDNKTYYDMCPEKFSDEIKKMVYKGVAIVGGCCGTTDNFIKEISTWIKEKNVLPRKTKTLMGVCTPSKTVEINGVKVIGEKINPSGRKDLKEALKYNKIDYILKEAILQVDNGADILDVNVGLPEIDETEVMIKVIKEIQAILDVPIQIDSANPKVIEKALRYYNGKPIINSVNGKEESLNEILPLAKKYGAMVIGLTLDEKGIPKTCDERVNVAKKIIDKALEYGIPKKDIIIDCLTLTASAKQELIGETLKALTKIKDELNVKTALGVSNISFGLPNRELLNRTFLSMALYAGLDLPIINPCDKEMMDSINAFKVLNNEDISSKNYIETYNNLACTCDKDLDENIDDLKKVIIRGMKDEAAIITKNMLKHNTELEIVNKYLIPALDEVGMRYESGEIFLPSLMQSAEAVKSAFNIIKKNLINGEKNLIYKDSIILATVKGDIHDIGKNIVKVILENYGYDVIDLGKDVDKEEILKSARDNNIKLIGLSALMTTTVKSMAETINYLRENKVDAKVMVGGAVLNQEYADMIHADYYAKDATDAVEFARKIFSNYE